MNIKVNSMRHVPLRDLNPGETFVLGDKYYIKTDEPYHGLQKTSTCVELKTGELVCCTDEGEVTPISLTVIETSEPEG